MSDIFEEVHLPSSWYNQSRLVAIRGACLRAPKVGQKSARHKSYLDAFKVFFYFLALREKCQKASRMVFTPKMVLTLGDVLRRGRFPLAPDVTR